MADVKPEEMTVPPQTRRVTDLPPDAPWYARWIVANVRESWKWFSVNLPLICAGLIQVYTQYQDQLESLVPKSWVPHITTAMLVLIALSRLVNQRMTPKQGPTP